MAAFEALFRQYERLVLSNAYLMVGSREEAQDVVQDVFSSVWKSRNSFDAEKAKFTTWLHAITVNECARRRRKKQPVVVRDVAEADLADEGFENHVMKQEERERVAAAVKKLDNEHRTVLVLRYFNDLSYAEIAQVLGIPLGTVKSRINKGIRSLREQFLETGEAGA